MIELSARGCDGKPGRDGESFGTDIPRPGLRGLDGGHALEAEPGQNGGSCEARLFTLNDGQFCLEGEICKPNGTKRVFKYGPLPVSAANCISIDVSGGNGGMGGNGGDGSKGGNGADDINPGGSDGGNAGSGSSGKAGGNGGQIRISIRASDIHLTKLFTCVAYSRGSGGKKGKHGNPAPGGSGTLGGKEQIVYKWVSGLYGRRKVIQSVIPAGQDGKPGKNGENATLELEDGVDGADGTFLLQVTQDDGSVVSYSSMTDLRVRALQLHSRSHSNILFEPGDEVSVMNAVIENLGNLALDSSDVSIRIDSHGSLEEIQNCLKLPFAKLAQGDILTVPGVFKLAIKHPEFTASHLPFTQEIPFECFVFKDDLQLKYEPSLRSSIRVSYPVRIENEIQMSHTLPVGGKLPLKLTVCNDSPTDLGINSNSGRRVIIKLQLLSADPALGSSILIQGSQNDSRHYLSDPFEHVVDLIKGSQKLDIHYSLEADRKAASGSRLILQVQLLLQTLGTEESCKCIQSIPIILATGYPYQKRAGQSVLLVTNDQTTAHEYGQWHTLLTSMGFDYCIFDTSHYKMFSLTKTIPVVESSSPKTNLLQDFFESEDYFGGLLIVLNNQNSRGFRAMDILDTMDLIALKKRVGMVLVILDEVSGDGVGGQRLMDLSIPVDRLQGACDPDLLDEELETKYELGSFQWLRLFSFFSFTFGRVQSAALSLQKEITDSCPRERPYIGTFLIDRGEAFVVIIPTLQGAHGGRIIHIAGYSESLRATEFSSHVDFKQALFMSSTTKLKLDGIFHPDAKAKVENGAVAKSLLYSVLYDMAEDMVGEWNEPQTIKRTVKIAFVQNAIGFLVDNKADPQILADMLGRLMGMLEFICSLYQRYFSLRTRYGSFWRVLKGYADRLFSSGPTTILQVLKLAKQDMLNELRAFYSMHQSKFPSKSAFLLHHLWAAASPADTQFQPRNMNLISGSDKRGTIATDLEYYDLVDRKEGTRKQRKRIWRALQKELREIDLDVTPSYMDGMARSMSTLASFSSINLLNNAAAAASTDNLQVMASTDQLVIK